MSQQQQLIQRQPTAAVAAADPQYLTFRLGEETFAIDILAIREIIEYGALTTVPLMPRCVRGVINLRGSVVPVIDLAARFGRGESAIHRRSCIVILELPGADGRRQELGVIVDAVLAVQAIPASAIEPPPSFGARLRSEFIRGMGKLGERFVIILDVAAVLDVDELAELARLSEDADAEHRP